MKVAVTGHRPNKLWGYDMKHPMYQTLAHALRAQLLELKADHIITGMALGVDTVFAFVGFNIKDKFNPDLQIECAIPCFGHTSKWKQESVDVWNKIVHRSDKTTWVSEKPYTNTCMQDRNVYMVNECDVLIAVWDGIKSGGTWNCVKYAKSKGKQIITINPHQLKGGE